MLAAHSLLRSATLAALTALVLSSAGYSRDAVDEAGTGADPDTITREGVNVQFSVSPVGGAGAVTADSWADVTFRVTDAGTGDPIKGRFPAA